MNYRKIQPQLEIENILTQYSDQFPLNLALAACWSIIHHKGENLKILEMKSQSSLADYYILADIQNGPQADAITENLTFNLKHHGYSVRGMEGKYDTQWRLIDFGDVMVHLFTNEARQVYSIEKLWTKATQIAIPESFYFQGRVTEENVMNLDESKKLTGYF